VKEREKRRPTKITQWIPREYRLKKHEKTQKQLNENKEDFWQPPKLN
jgi:hypothetical protein